MNPDDLKYRIVETEGSDEAMMTESLASRLMGVDAVCIKRLPNAGKGKPAKFRLVFWMTDREYDKFQSLIFETRYGNLDHEYEKLLEDV